MKIGQKLQEEISLHIVNTLSEQTPLSRKELISRVLKKLGFSSPDRNPNSRYNIIRSVIGTELSSLSIEGLLVRSSDGYSLASEELVVVTFQKCKTEIIKLLKKSSYTKKEIFALLIKRFGADNTASLKDDETVRTLAGNVLASLVSQGELEIASGRYSIKRRITAEEIKNPLPENKFSAFLFSVLHDKGGAFFEQFLSNTLEKYFILTGREVLTCAVTGGSADGGIDIIIETLDDLGFSERIMVQAKCRFENHTTEKEVREFYGAMTALSGTKGIFVTTADFHEGALKFLATLDNCVGIDRKKLFEIIKKTGYGIHKTTLGYTLDSSIFSY